MQELSGVSSQLALEVLARHGVMASGESAVVWRRELRGECCP